MEVHFNLKPFTFHGNQAATQPLIVAGPCSAESEKQLLHTAHALKSSHVNLFRAGIWKPRTRPGGFQGLGGKALPWLKKVKDETGLAVATEVANEDHVYQALKHNVDVLWIGARTTANPFAVQEIANALEGVDIPVMVKNPINPDLELWLGAIERLNQIGIKRLAAIHRGFSTYEKSVYRNPPKWNIPQELKKIVPDLPIITDPSHICGNRTLLQKISKRALEKGFHGLMIEVHPDPNQALSDATQQITPDMFHHMMSGLNINRHVIQENDDLDKYRKTIDILDEELLNIIEKRMNMVLAIGKFKKNNKISVFQEERWKELLFQRIEKGSKKGLNNRFIKKLFETIHNESVNTQKTEKLNVSKRDCDILVNK